MFTLQQQLYMVFFSARRRTSADLVYATHPVITSWLWMIVKNC